MATMAEMPENPDGGCASWFIPGGYFAGYFGDFGQSGKPGVIGAIERSSGRIICNLEYVDYETYKMLEMNERIPVQQSGYQLEEIDGEILLYNPKNTTTVYLNRSAAIVWQLCDGSSSVAEISELICSRTVENQDVIRRDVSNVIDQFLVQNIIVCRKPLQGNGR